MGLSVLLVKALATNLILVSFPTVGVYAGNLAVAKNLCRVGLCQFVLTAKLFGLLVRPLARR